MREALGNTFLYNVIIVFIFVALLVLVGSLGYSKGFKAKNRIISIIEDNKGYDETAMIRIDQALKDNGYRLKSVFRHNSCPTRNGVDALTESNNYMYCVYPNTTPRGMYYTVVIYIRFEVPIISGLLEFPVSGDTKTIYDISG